MKPICGLDAANLLPVCDLWAKLISESNCVQWPELWLMCAIWVSVSPFSSFLQQHGGNYTQVCVNKHQQSLIQILRPGKKLHK